MVNANIIISVSLSIAIAANVGQYVKSTQQRRTITRMRKRLKKLEDQGLGS